jgi:hypothetical protein
MPRSCNMYTKFHKRPNVWPKETQYIAKRDVGEKWCECDLRPLLLLIGPVLELLPLYLLLVLPVRILFYFLCIYFLFLFFAVPASCPPCPCVYVHEGGWVGGCPCVRMCIVCVCVCVLHTFIKVYTYTYTYTYAYT